MTILSNTKSAIRLREKLEELNQFETYDIMALWTLSGYQTGEQLDYLHAQETRIRRSYNRKRNRAIRFHEYRLDIAAVIGVVAFISFLVYWLVL